MSKLNSNLIKNGFASALSQAMRVFEQLFLIPFYIAYWGSAYYGEWISLTIIPNIIGFSDLGFGTATANYFVLEYVGGNYKKAANLLKTGLNLITKMIFFGLLIGILVMFILKYYNFLEKSIIDQNQAIIAISILTLARLLKFYTQVFSSYFRASRNAALGTNLLTLFSLANIFSAVFVLINGFNIIVLSISQLVTAIIFNLYYSYRGIKLISHISHKNATYDKSLEKDIKTKGLGFLMSPIWQAIFFQGTTLIVRVNLGPETVAVFNTIRTLSRSVNQLFNLVNLTVFPELQFEIGKGNWKKAQSLFRFSNIVIIIIAALGVTFLILFGQPIYNYWTHNKLEMPKNIWNLFMIGIIFNAFWWNSEMVFTAMNKPYKLAISGVVCSILAVCTVIGSNLMELLMAIVVLPMACELLGIKTRTIFTEGLKESFSFLNKKLRSQNIKN
jgi:O-antigen/teichoic acid export membrane protein